ncbi:MAG: 50S ribosomal protein L19 [Candidatus Omnitrophota bacterium]
MDKIKEIIKKKLKKDIPEFFIGDVIKVHVKIMEAGKERIQPFEGTVIARKNSGINETFTLRRISYGEGLERIFLLHSPTIERIEHVRTGKVKRAKLYYLRKRVGKKAKVDEKIGQDAAEQNEPSNAEQGA